jgi:hypothetical protein
MAGLTQDQLKLISYEDVELIVSSADLLANDTLGGFLGRDLSIPAVMNPRHGTVFLGVNGFVHFTPEAKCLPRTSGHRFKRHAANDGRMEWAA